VEIMLVWIAGLAGLRGADRWSGDRAGLCRPEGHSPVAIVNVCGFLAWQALGAWSGRDCAALEGLRSRSKFRRSHGLQSSGSSGLFLSLHFELYRVEFIYTDSISLVPISLHFPSSSL
jgi:hypothetical protein